MIQWPGALPEWIRASDRSLDIFLCTSGGLRQTLTQCQPTGQRGSECAPGSMGRARLNVVAGYDITLDGSPTLLPRVTEAMT
jgi:hypothetical protein